MCICTAAATAADTGGGECREVSGWTQGEAAARGEKGVELVVSCVDKKTQKNKGKVKRAVYTETVFFEGTHF